MYLSKLGFFNKKIAIEKQQLLNFLNLLTANLTRNGIKKMQLAYLQQGLSLLTATAKGVKQKRFAIKLKYSIRKRKAKNRFILRKNHQVDFVGTHHKEVKISSHIPSFAKIEVRKKAPRNRVGMRVRP